MSLTIQVKYLRESMIREDKSGEMKPLLSDKALDLTQGGAKLLEAEVTLQKLGGRHLQYWEVGIYLWESGSGVAEVRVDVWFLK